MGIKVNRVELKKYHASDCNPTDAMEKQMKAEREKKGTILKSGKEKKMQLIAAVDKNWAIGRKGQMLVTIPAIRNCFGRKPSER